MNLVLRVEILSLFAESNNCKLENIRLYREKLSDQTFSTGAQSKAKPTLRRTADEEATTEKDSDEEKNANDAEIAPLAEEDPAQLDEELDAKQLELKAATEACGNGTLEDVIKSLDDKPEKKSTGVLDDSRLVLVLALSRLGSRAHNQSGSWGKRSKRL